MATRAEMAARPRRRYIDWARGLAVLIMIEAHTLDAWTRASSKHGDVYGRLSILGGFAAPLFLWLAGLSLVLAAEASLQRGATRAEAAKNVLRRGAEIFILAFLFRLQAFVISPGSWPITIFRVDILNVMGIAIAATGLVWWWSGGRWRAVASCALAATAIAMITPVVREAAWVDVLPLWIQWHLRPFGDHTTFTLFPWAGFVFSGAVVGLLLSNVATQRGERRLLTGIGLAGAGLLWLGFYTAGLPTIYRVSTFWSSSPTFFAIRVGVMAMAVSLLFLCADVGRWRLPGLDVIEGFGKNSLFIYWIHVELVYGYATWPLRHRLPIWGTALAYLAFTAVMFAAIGWRDRAVESWKARAMRPTSAGPVPA